MADQVDRDGKITPSVGWNCLDENVTFHMRKGDKVIKDEGTCPIGGDWIEKDLGEIMGDKRVLIVTLPGAFTPTCTNNQGPDFEELYDDIKAAGNVDEIYIMAVNDAYVMNAWAQSIGLKKVKMLPDGNTSFTKRLFMDVVMHKVGFGVRCRRSALLFDNGRLVHKWIEDLPSVEDPDPYATSSAAFVLARMKGTHQTEEVIEDLEN